ncbi:MAG: Fur family transcriptional regulator [Acidobacteriota bacterium]
MSSGKDLKSEAGHDEIAASLRRHGIRPSAQRVAVARFVLQTDEHPSAERVLAAVRRDFPMISRATVYNTLHLFVEHGLLREVRHGASSVVYDANVDRHHHLIDDETGEIHDLPWTSIEIDGVEQIEDFEILEYRVVLKGRRRSAATPSSADSGSTSTPRLDQENDPS